MSSLDRRERRERFRRFLSLSLWIAAACWRAAAAGTATLDEPLVIRSWGTEAGLPQNTVNAILQTRDGYLWLGTRDGLARFDGVRFTLFGLREGLPSVEVLSLYEDSQGTLWIGTSGGGLSRLAEGRIQPVPLPQVQSGREVVSCLAEDAQGRLWIGTRAGLVIWSEGQTVSLPALAGLERSPISAIHRDRRGAMWIAAARDGLLVYHDQQVRESPGPPGNERILAYCLLEDQAGGIWASVGNGRVLRHSGDEWCVFDQSHGLPFAFVTSLAEEGDGTIWAGSLDAGLYQWRGGRFLAAHNPQGKAPNDIRSLGFDREGNLWVGTRTEGVSRLTRRHLDHWGAAQGLTNDFTRGVVESADGVFWVGTYGGGLNRGGAQGFEPTEEEAPNLRFAFVDSVLAMADGSLWYGARRGLFRLDHGKLSAAYTNEPWLGSASATALCADGDGGLWVGTSEGQLARCRQGRFTPVTQRVARGPVNVLVRQPDGRLWVGSEAGGLQALRPSNNAVASFSDGLLSQAVRSLHLDRQNTLWIGTAGGGLSCLRSGRTSSFSKRQGLTIDTVSQILEDDDGRLWLGSSRGIFRVDKAELLALADGRISFVHPRVFGLSDGMPAEECSSGFCPAGLKTRSGRLCFPTVKGVVILDPRRPETNAPPPRVMLEEIVLNGQTHPPRSESARRLEVPAGSRELELHYTAISFAAPEKVRFRYRMEGLDQGWTEAGNLRIAYYHRLPAGQYHFAVRAANADGVWSEAGAQLAVQVHPFLWETPWFLALSSVGGVGLLAAGVRLVERRRYRRRLAVLELQHAVERERLRISQDMHDDIGSILTQVSLLSEMGQAEARSQPAQAQFERILSHTRTAVQALDEIVWATNPKNDNLPRFVEYICRFADECLEPASIRCWQDVPTNVPNHPLGAEVRHNLFLAVKEALNNVLKHAGAKAVWLRLELAAGEACLTIEDNGRGFTPAAQSQGRNGLSNMHHRLAECGGRIELESRPGQGARLRFLFPIGPPA